MKTKFLKSKEAFDLGLVLLAKTTILTDDLISRAPWNSIKDLYGSLGPNESPVFGYAVSILNAICTHKRAYFALTRASVAKLVREDSNHISGRGFSNELYPALRAFLQDQKYIKLFVPGNKSRKKADTFEVIDSDLLQYVNLYDLSQQMAEAKSFSEHTDHNTDPEVSNKKAESTEKKNSNLNEAITGKKEDLLNRENSNSLSHPENPSPPQKAGWRQLRQKKNEGT